METKKIGNFVITDKDYQGFISRLPQEQQMYATSVPEFAKQCEERLEEIVLFAAMGEEMNLEASNEYKETMEVARRECLSQLAMGSVLRSIEVNDQSAKEYFDAHQDQYKQQPSASAKHILVDTEEKAQEIKEQIASQAISFEDAAKAHSSCPSSAQGGDLGTFSPGQMVKEFDDAVFSATVGELIGPVKTQFGYHLITVTNLTEEKPSTFEEVKDRALQDAVRDMQNEAYQAKVKELRERYL